MQQQQQQLNSAATGQEDKSPTDSAAPELQQVADLQQLQVNSVQQVEAEIKRLQQELTQLHKHRVKQGKMAKELRDLVKLWHWDRR
jgi:uncharacterized protein (UPF0335 family)